MKKTDPRNEQPILSDPERANAVISIMQTLSEHEYHYITLCGQYAAKEYDEVMNWRQQPHDHERRGIYYTDAYYKMEKKYYQLAGRSREDHIRRAEKEAHDRFFSATVKLAARLRDKGITLANIKFEKLEMGENGLERRGLITIERLNDGRINMKGKTVAQWVQYAAKRERQSTDILRKVG